MKVLKNMAVLSAALLMSSFQSAQAATFVYVSNAEDGDISTYRMADSGELEPGPKAAAADVVMPMTVNAEKTVLYAAIRSEPYSVYSYRIDQETGALTPLDQSPLPNSMLYLALDSAGTHIFSASYGGNIIAVNTVAADGSVSRDPLQVVPAARNMHAILPDRTSRYVFAPSLGDDMVLQFTFDEQKGLLTSNTPAVVLMDEGTGPRHLVVSADNRFVYVLSEFHAKVIVFSLDEATGLLRQVSEVDGMEPGDDLRAGRPRKPVAAGMTVNPADTAKDIWAADLHLTPDGRFLYISERTSSTLRGFAVDGETGGLTYIGATPTETQPRGFAIDDSGAFLVAAGQKSEEIAVYAIDRKTGGLEKIGNYPGGRGANWVEIVTIENGG